MINAKNSLYIFFASCLWLVSCIYFYRYEPNYKLDLYGHYKLFDFFHASNDIEYLYDSYFGLSILIFIINSLGLNKEFLSIFTLSIIFLSVFFINYQYAKNLSSIKKTVSFIICLMILPIFDYVSGIRFGCGIAFLLLFFTCDKKFFKLFFAILSISMHFFMVFFFLVFIISRLIPNLSKFSAFLFLFICISLSILFFQASNDITQLMQGMDISSIFGRGSFNTYLSGNWGAGRFDLIDSKEKFVIYLNIFLFSLLSFYYIKKFNINNIINKFIFILLCCSCLFFFYNQIFTRISYVVILFMFLNSLNYHKSYSELKFTKFGCFLFLVISISFFTHVYSRMQYII
ncbi:hypothetical protein [Providencia sp. PROV142]|uniref:hypothetical protein n=1 Tax=Providencia sp. PROV142 TaxID=2949852 RepID=UPI00234911DF|nr:hypothetical protein [Providencia sp. PROV142]